MPKDLLDALLAPPAPLSTVEAVDVLADVLTAGGDTTASTLSTAALLLQKHPDAARRVADEAAALLGADASETPPAAGELAAAVAQPSALAYTRAVLLEAARLYPAAPLLLRVALADTSVGGVPIPAGSGVVASTSQLGRHPSAWEAPDEFVPERFVAGHPAYRSAEAAKAYMAFGAGPRSCIGQQLALSVASLLLAQMVRAAAAEGLLPEDDFDHDEEAAPDTDPATSQV